MEIAARDLHSLHKASVRAGTGDDQTLLLELGAELVVELIAVAVALVDLRRAVAVGHLRARRDDAGVLAQTHRAALRLNALLVRHQVNDVVLALGRKFAGVGVGVAQYVAGVLHDHDLHAQADAEIGHVVLTRVLRSLDHALDAAVTKAARHNDAVHVAQLVGAAGLVDEMLTVDPLDLDLALVLKARVVQALHDAQISVVQLDVLTDQRNLAGLAAGRNAADERLPLGQIARRGLQVQLAGHDVRQTGGFQHQRALVQARHRQVFNDAVGAHVAEHADLALDVVAYRAVGAQDDDVRRNAHALQLLAGVLRGLGLVFVGAGDVGHQYDMDIAAVLGALLQTDLTDGLQEGLALDVAGGAADLGDDDVRLGALGQIIDIALDLVGDVGDDLHGLAQISALTLLVQDVPVDLAGGQVRVFVQIFVDEALIMAEVEVCLGAVVGHEHLAVLQRAHRARVNVDVGVQLLAGHLQSAGLEQTSQAGRCDALAQARHNAAGHKNILRCHNSPSMSADAKQQRPPYPKNYPFHYTSEKTAFAIWRAYFLY